MTSCSRLAIVLEFQVGKQLVALKEGSDKGTPC
jgi:hypothetical protein